MISANNELSSNPSVSKLGKYLIDDTLIGGVVEGVQLFRRAHEQAFDYKIWMELSFEEGLRRAVERRGHLTGRKTPSEIEEMYRKRSTPGHELYIQRDCPVSQSDLMINGERALD